MTTKEPVMVEDKWVAVGYFWVEPVPRGNTAAGLTRMWLSDLPKWQAENRIALIHSITEL